MDDGKDLTMDHRENPTIDDGPWTMAVNRNGMFIHSSVEKMQAPKEK
jgi:hypothetical protein